MDHPITSFGTFHKDKRLASYIKPTMIDFTKVSKRNVG
jgi:hypothetical protein